jgi:hypothetical protein
LVPCTRKHGGYAVCFVVSHPVSRLLSLASTTLEGYIACLHIPTNTHIFGVGVVDPHWIPRYERYHPSDMANHTADSSGVVRDRVKLVAAPAMASNIELFPNGTPTTNQEPVAKAAPEPAWAQITMAHAHGMLLKRVPPHQWLSSEDLLTNVFPACARPQHAYEASADLLHTVFLRAGMYHGPHPRGAHAASRQRHPRYGALSTLSSSEYINNVIFRDQAVINYWFADEEHQI